jgi:hypothetical protein
MDTTEWAAVGLLVIAAWGLYCAIFPRRVWGWFRSWRFKNPEAVEPSDLVLAWRSVTSGIAAIVLLYFGVHTLVVESPQERLERCDQTVAELRELYAEEDESLPPVRQRARELGVEIEVNRSGTGPPRIWIMDGDDYLGLLTEPGFSDLNDTECWRYASS